MFRYVGPDWKPNPWEHLPGLTLASTILALVLAILGCLVFSKPNIGLTIAVSIFLVLCYFFRNFINDYQKKKFFDNFFQIRNKISLYIYFK